MSDNFYMRDFLHSEIASIYGLTNAPDDPDLAIEAGTNLCQILLEPLYRTFGSVAIRSAYRSREVNGLGNEKGHNCATNEKNHADHIWDRRDDKGNMGATACVVVPWFATCYENGADWRQLAWWIHDHLPYNRLCFFPKLAAFNINWRENRNPRIDSFVAPRGCLTKTGMDNFHGSHADLYAGFPTFNGRVTSP